MFNEIQINEKSYSELQAANTPHYPPHFLHGSLIAIGNGSLKKVEDLTTDDFIQSANLSINLKINVSEVIQMLPIIERDTVQLSFAVGPQKIQVTVESTLEHPFFVFNRGWSSYNPARTLHRYKLKCYQLNVGDLCISLTKKEATNNIGLLGTNVTSADNNIENNYNLNNFSTAETDHV